MELEVKYTLNEIEQKIVQFIATQRQINKENTGWNGIGTAATDDKHLERNIIGFGAEFIFCREQNLFPDFTIGNFSKIQGTDAYDAKWGGYTIDVKATDKQHPLMTPTYSKSDAEVFAFFWCDYPTFIFKGYTTNKMLFDQKNIKKFKVESYVLENHLLLSEQNLLPLFVFFPYFYPL